MPTPIQPPKPPTSELKSDGLVHEGIVRLPPATGKAPKRAPKCGGEGATTFVSPRAAFLREVRRSDPTAEGEGRVPSAACPACWPGNGIIVRAAPATKKAKKPRK